MSKNMRVYALLLYVSLYAERGYASIPPLALIVTATLTFHLFYLPFPSSIVIQGGVDILASGTRN